MDSNELKQVAEMVSTSQKTLVEDLVTKLTNALAIRNGNAPEPEAKQATQKLEPGVYVLTKDVPNPSGDKRVTSNFEKIPVWPKGALVTVKHLSPTGKSKRAVSVAPFDTIVETRNNRMIHVEKGTVFNTSDGFDKLAAALKKEPESVRTTIEEVGFSGPLEVLDILQKSGKISLEEIRHLKD